MSNKFLKNSIEVLNKLRNTYYSQLDDSDLTELDKVISALNEAQSHEKNDADLNTLSLRVLQIIGYLIKLVTNLTDLMK